MLAFLLVAAVLIGGGGVAYGLHNLTVQLVALAILGFNRETFLTFWREANTPLRWLVGASLALPMLQLVPLPWDMTSALPGREQLSATFALLGEYVAFPVSLAPHRTLVALTGLIVPLTILALGIALPRTDIKALMLVAVGLGLTNVLIGVPQVSSNGAHAILYPENPMPGILFGSFANRNTTGLFLVIALTLLIVPRWHRFGKAMRLGQIAITVLIGLGIVLTQSRSAIVLATIPLGLAGLRMTMALFKRPPSGRFAVALGGAALIAVMGLALAASTNTRISNALERFAFVNEGRAYIWEDAAFSAQKYWPVGAGMGGFDEVFQTDETLENLTVRRAGRAHNDYLELTIEGGLPALAILVGWLLLIGWLSWTARQSPDRWTAWAGSAILLALSTQSILDYPLRNQAMLAVAALAMLVLVRFSKGGAR